MILTPHLVLRNGAAPTTDVPAGEIPLVGRPLVELPLVELQDPAGPQSPDPNAADTVTRGRAGDSSSMDGRGDPNPPEGPEGSGVPQGCFDQQSLIFVLLFVGVIYFMMLRPQQKQEKKLREMRSALQKGDRAVTGAGIHGVVDSLTEETVTLRVDSDVRLTFDRSAIARVADDGSQDATTPAES